MKKVALFAFIFLIIGIIGTITFGGQALSINPSEKASLDKRQQVDGSDISNIEVTMAVGDIRIEPSDDDNIYVHLHGDGSESYLENLNFDVDEDGDSLVVKVNTKEQFFNFSFSSLFNFDFNGNVNLDILIPEKRIAELDVNSDVGDTFIERINAETLIVSSDVGDIHVEQVTSSEAEIESDVGSIFVDEGIGKFDIKSNTGDTKLNILEITEDISIRSDVGDVLVSLDTQPVNMVLDLSSDVGDVSVSNIQGAGSSSADAYYVEIGSGGPTLQVKADVGEITVRH